MKTLMLERRWYNVRYFLLPAQIHSFPLNDTHLCLHCFLCLRCFSYLQSAYLSNPTHPSKLCLSTPSFSTRSLTIFTQKNLPFLLPDHSQLFPVLTSASAVSLNLPLNLFSKALLHGHAFPQHISYFLDLEWTSSYTIYWNPTYPSVISTATFLGKLSLIVS